MPVDASAETRRSRPFGLLHVHCVDVVLDRGCLRTAETLRLQLGYGAQRQSCAGTIERDGDGAGRTYLHRRGAAFEVKASQHAPRCVTVAVVGEGHPEAVGTLDVAALLESALDHVDARVRLEPEGGGRGAMVRVLCAFDVLEAPLRPRDVVAWSGLLRPERIYPLSPDERLVVVAVAGDAALVAAGDAHVALRRSWLRKTGERAPASTIAALAASPLRRVLEDSIEQPGVALDRARGGAARLKDRWRAGGVEAVCGDVLYALGAADGPARTARLVATDSQGDFADEASSASDEEETVASEPARGSRSSLSIPVSGLN